jgi:uncharacterized protein (TIGR00297 family)
MQLLLGVVFGAVIAILAYKAGALNQSGAVAAALIGGLIFGLGGLAWATLLLVFFISSSVLSRAFESRKSGLLEKSAKGSRRDYGQVLANGGLGALLAVLLVVSPGQDWQWIAFTGAMAAVTADTWATEVGTISSINPVLITNGRRVESGTSGGVTFAGYLASLCGSLLIGIAAAVFSPALSVWEILLIASLGGIAGGTLDSLLGATLQGIYYCPQCEKETESYPRHRCGTQTSQLRGWRWLDNDLVNFLCSLAGAGVALVSWNLLQ